MSKQHTTAAIIFAAIILLVLAVMPAQAQDAPPVAGATSDTLYLPVITRTFPSWFTDAELTQAQVDAGYDPVVASMHTNCYLDPSSQPPDIIRYSSCEQYYVDGVATEGTQHYIWWLKFSDGILHGVEVGGTMVQSAGTDAPCYTEDDGEVVCG